MARLFSTCVWSVLTVLCGSVASADHHDELQLTRIKPADAETRRLVRDGYSRSLTFSQLVDELQRSNVIVVVQFGACAGGRIRSCVSHVGGDAQQRHIRIKVSTRTTDDRVIATIAHELQHAREIAREANVTNAEEVIVLYRRIAIGQCRSRLSEECETEAALNIERRVNDEVSRTARR